MPNISFDIFFDQDFINVSASRGKTAPKEKPEWKVRTAPKLPPKEPAAGIPGAPRPPQREKLTTSRNALNKQPDTSNRVTDVTDNASQVDAGETPKRKPPKLGAKKVAEAKA